MHAVFYRKVDPNTEPMRLQKLLPLPQLAAAAAEFPLEAALSVLTPQVPVLRETFIGVASAALGGDRLAAEYLLLHVVSRIYTRVQGLCLGQFCLNINSVAAAAPPMHTPARQISQLLDSLLPTVHTFELSVANLNSTTMIPKKDYDQNRLVAGMLQLANGTELLVDETRMDEGQLNENGVANLKAMAGISQTGTLELDFGNYGNVSIDMDVSMLTLSSQKSLLPSSCTIPHVPQAASQDISGALDPATGEPALSGMRAYLAVMREVSSRGPREMDDEASGDAAAAELKFEISSEAEEHVQRDFVACRKTDRTLKAEDLHRWLTMARLFAISHGDTKVRPSSASRLPHLPASHISD